MFFDYLCLDNQWFAASFKDRGVRVNDLLGAIPESLLSHFSATTTVDYYTQVLHGRKMFYLLLYGILENDRLSQRTLEGTFNNSVFKILFGLDTDEKVRHSSLSERLSKISVDYFVRFTIVPMSNSRNAIPVQRWNDTTLSGSIVRSFQIHRVGWLKVSTTSAVNWR